ncbi:MAG: PAS domain S-box protein [Flavobacterium sp.]|nr:MAG: PAS domain S-box protein [Flavobacterium sp.]
MDDIPQKRSSFLNSGEMAQLITRHDWSRTSVGEIHGWSASLKLIVNTVLSSRFPMLIFWGEELTAIYNDAFCQSLANDGGQHTSLGKNCKEILAESWPALESMARGVLNGGQAIESKDQKIPVYRDGKWSDAFWTYSLSPVANDAGEIGGVLVVCSETTEKVRNLEHLRENENQLHFALYAGNLGAWELDLRTFDLVGSTKCKANFGRGADDLFNYDILISAIHPNDLERQQLAVKAAIEKEQELDIDYRAVWPDGTIHWVNVRGQMRKDAGGNPVSIIGTSSEITGRKISEQTLLDSEDRFRKLITDAPIPMIVFSGSDFVMQIVNNAYLEIVGRNRNDLIDKPAFENFPQSREALEPLLKSVFDSGKPLSGEEFEYTFAGQTEPGYYNFIISPVFGDSGETSGCVAILSDVTAQVVARKKSESARQALELAVEIADLGDFYVDISALTATYSQKIVDWFGIDGKNISVSGFRDAIHPDDRKMVTDAIAETLNGKNHGKHDLLFRIFHADGETIRYLRSIGKVQNAQEGKTAIIGMMQDVTEQVLSTKTIADSEARLRTLIEQSPIATGIYTGPDLKIEMANQMMLDIWGKQDAVGKTLSEAIPELDGQPFLGLLRQIFITGEPFHGKAMPADLVVDGTLSTFYFDFTYQPIFNSSGEVWGIMNIAVDITENVLVQQRIDEAQREVLASFEESPIAIANISNENLTFRVVNSFYANLVGRKPSELIDKPMLEALPELKGQGFDELLQRVIDSGEAYTAKEVPAQLLRNGQLQTVYVDLTYQPRWREKEVAGVLVVAVDVTAQVVSRKVIEERESELLGAIELAGLATWTMNIKENRFYYSERFMEWLGFSEKTQDLDGAYNPLPEDYRESVPEALAKAIAAGSDGFYENEHPIVNRTTGQTRIIHAQGQVFYDNTGNPEVLSGTALDITLQRELQLALKSEVEMRTEELADAVEELRSTNDNLQESNVQLRQSNAELAQFAYIASHDLQEPLRKISTFSQLLESSLGENVSEKSIGYLEKIRNSSQRMTNLIRGVLQYSQISTEQRAFSKVDLNKLIREIISDYDLLIEQKKGRITLSPLPIIEAIPLQMTQLFANLIGNALKFSRPDNPPVITITAGVADEHELDLYKFSNQVPYAKIEISDNGIGFQKEYAEKIFHIFQRLHSKSQYEGTGIGLALCKKIVVNHHGDIVAAVNSGGGAVFTVFLPIRNIDSLQN